jgi:flagella basal body P-ring formation protein FlgA
MIFAVAIAAAAPSDAGSLEESLASWVQETCEAESVEVVYSGLGVDLPEGATFVWDGSPCGRSPSLRVTVVEGGVPSDRYSIKPRLNILVKAPVARTDVEPGQLVLVTEGVVPITEVQGDPLTGQVIARGHIDAGDVVSSFNARPSPDGQKGDEVVLFVNAGALTVEAPGTLVADATLGQPVKVVNDATKTMLTGVLTEPGRVQIQ